MFNTYFLAIFCIAFTNAQNNTNKSEISLEDYCFSIPELLIGNRTRELECCERVHANLFKYWSTQRVYLTRTLATLQAWNCPQFNEACSNRSLDFTDYTSLIYDRFCNQSSLLQRCGSVLDNVLSVIGKSRNVNNSNWIKLASSLDSSLLNNEQLTETCVQVALYDSENGGWKNYHEIITFIVPFCDSSWCGFDADTIEKRNITPWTCLFAKCKTNIVLIMAVFCILAITIVIANFTIILVYSTEKKLRHSQGIFRLSLGVADLFTGLIVFPAAANTLWKIYRHELYFRPSINVTGEVLSDNLSFEYFNATVSYDRLESRLFSVSQVFPRAFQNSIGFFTTLSLTVSIYLLTVSGVDRLQAITRPLKYRQHSARRFAITASIVCWVLSFIVSLIPIIFEKIFYIITGSGLVTLTGELALILYAVAFFTPLIATWIIAIAMFVQGKKSFQRRATMSTVRKKHLEQQRRLNVILSLMVTAFSLSILPTVIVLVLVIFIPGTDPRFPQTYNPVFSNITNSLEAIAVIVLMCNSLWNCLIYSLRTKSFRKIAKEKYRKILDTINPVKLWSSFTKSLNAHQRHSFKHRSSSKTGSTSYKTHTSRVGSVKTSSPQFGKKSSPIAPRQFHQHHSNTIQEESENSSI